MAGIIKPKIRKSTFERFLEKINKDDPSSNGCWFYNNGKDRDGYGMISINDHPRKAHQISYMTFKGPIEKDKHVCHSCDNPSCINPVHLFLGTNKENMRDKINKGRDRVRGEQNVKSILTDELVKQILLEKDHLTIAEIARKHGLSWEHASAVIKRKIWRHIDVSI